MRRILPGWLIAISAVAPEVEVAADAGTALLTQAAMSAIFGKTSGDSITIDPSIAKYLVDDFELDDSSPQAPLLVRTRTTGP